MLAAWLIWNLFVFILFGLDKSRAIRGAWRIPENILLGTSLLFGGTGGFLGSQLFRHKTRVTLFRIILPIALIISLAAAAVILFI